MKLQEAFDTGFEAVKAYVDRELELNDARLEQLEIRAGIKQKSSFDSEAFGERLAQKVKDYVQRQIEPLVERIDAIEGGGAKTAKPRVKLPTSEKRMGLPSMVLKSMSDDERVIEGIASTPTLDRSGDIVEPGGAQYKLPIPLLLDHNHKEQVGVVEFARATPAGIEFRARIRKVDEPGAVKDLVDRAWHLVKHELRSAVSIGFRAIDGGYDIMPNGGLRFNKWEWFELSLVSVPAQADAVITGYRDFGGGDA